MTYVSQCLADGAVGLWKLAEPSGTTATDQTSNSNGTYAGSITYGVTGIPGGAGATAVQNTTSSTGNKVTIPDVVANRTTDTFTLEIWVKRTATQSAVQRIMGSNGTNGCQFGFNASNQITLGKIAVANIVSATTALTDTTNWHHLVATKSGATSKLYLDGVDVTGTPTNQTIATSIGYVIMEDNSNNNAPPAGVGFSHAAVYPTALSAATVLTHYNIGAAVAPTNTVAPAVTGTTQVGQTLTTTNGTWTSTGTPAFTYQWQDSADGATGWANISSATSSTYVIGAGESGKFIRCVVTDTDSASSATANSNVVGAITGGSISTIIGKTGTSGTAVMQKSAAGYTYITGKTGTSGTAVDQKGAGSFTKVKGH